MTARKIRYARVEPYNTVPFDVCQPARTNIMAKLVPKTHGTPLHHSGADWPLMEVECLDMQSVDLEENQVFIKCSPGSAH